MPKCKVCKKVFYPKYSSLEKTCSLECHIKYNKKNPPKKIKRVSNKRKVQEDIYNQLRKVFLNKNPKCEICGLKSEDLHHKAGRIGNLLINTKYFMALCRKDHDYVHNNPEESKRKKWIIKIY